MKSLLLVVKEEFLSKGITLALLEYFPSIHSTKNSYEALKLLSTEKIDVVISEINFNTIDTYDYVKEIIKYSTTLKSIILLADSPLSIDDYGRLKNLTILPKPVSIQDIIHIINQLEENISNNKNGE